MIPLLLLSLTFAADPMPKIPIGKETTFVDGPLDAEGYVRYGDALNAMLSKGVTPENNANVLLWQAFGPRPGGTEMPKAYFDALGIKEPPAEGDDFLNLADYLRTIKSIKPKRFAKLYEKLSDVGGEPWSAEQYPIVADWLQHNDKALSLVREGLARPRYFNPIVVKDDQPLIGALLPVVQLDREFANLLRTRAMLNIEQGKFDDAWADILACHHLARHLTQGGSLIECLVGYAVEGIAQGAALRLIQAEDVSAEQLTTWQADFEKLPKFKPFYETLDQGERLIALDAIQYIMRKPNTLKEIISDDLDMTNIDWAVLFKTYNQTIDQTVKLVTVDMDGETPMNLAAIQKQFDELRPRPKPIPDFLQMFMSPKERAVQMAGVYYDLVGPATLKVFEANVRILQIGTLERIAFSLALHHEATGSYPNQLAELKLSRKPIDLYNGKPLHYTKTATGYLLYSVGLNQEDDNGQSFGDEPRGDDLVVTVPIPEK